MYPKDDLLCLILESAQNKLMLFNNDECETPKMVILGLSVLLPIDL